jgi:hypothetical protein
VNFPDCISGKSLFLRKQNSLKPKAMSDTITSAPLLNPRNEENVFKIMVATDIHLGYGEKKENIGK